MNSTVKILKALADPVRLRIVEFLQRPDPSCCSHEDSVCACDLERNLGLAQPTISHHMKILVDAGLVSAEKRGRWMYYDLRQEAFAELVGFLERYHPKASCAGPHVPTRPGQGGF
jgi:ArsR family transcriptional regulator, arsenate/arsenite/antimonite-responsive transcriptional repressor